MAKDNDLIQKGDGNDEGDAPVEHWDSIIASNEVSLAGYERDLKKYQKDVQAKKRKTNPSLQARLQANISDHKNTIRILKKNRKRRFGA
jgi:hypothetical protein